MRVLRKIGVALTWVLLAFGIVLLVAVLAARFSGETPKLFGFRFYVIGSGSMEPELQVGDFIIAREYHEGDELHAYDDIVTYRCTSGEMAGKTITHRVVEVLPDGKTVITKGDNNQAKDSPVKTKDILSVMVAKVGFLGWIFRATETPLGFIMLFVVPMLVLIGFEIFDFFKGFKKETKEETNENAEK